MTETLRTRLEYEPVELKFGTSGRRGQVAHLTQLEVYINAIAELEYLQALPLSEGGIVKGDPFYFAYDLRPSSSRFVENQGGRGEIAQAIVRAIHDSAMQPINLGRIPTPALAHYAISQKKGSIMITGSHIPFDRNGYKVNTSCGELLKKDEIPITKRVWQVRDRVYRQPYQESLFDSQGLFKTGSRELLPENAEARSAYINRYVKFFNGRSLKGNCILCYQHSAVGRDMLVEILDALGAKTIPVGRSDAFIPIDTENIEDSQIAAIQILADQARTEHGTLMAIVSTDGDSDRPLVLGVDGDSGKAIFFGGDLLGMISADFLAADAVVVPISCNDGIDRGSLQKMLEPKTRIGSPYVIEGMEKARLKGKQAICGWEANGGFMTGSNIEKDGNFLSALPTRDAILPILCALFASQDRRLTLAGLFATLPKRFSRASLLKNFPRTRSLEIARHFSPSDATIKEIWYDGNRWIAFDEDANEFQYANIEQLNQIRLQLKQAFSAELGFTHIARVNYVDGVRIIFKNGEVAHVRPSGNADELRIYAVADSQFRADEIVKAGVADPGGILRKLEQIAIEGKI